MYQYSYNYAGKEGAIARSIKIRSYSTAPLSARIGRRGILRLQLCLQKDCFPLICFLSSGMNQCG